MSELLDEELVARFRDQGDRSAFEALVTRHRGRLYALSMRMLKNEEEALEVLQDTFLSAFRKLPEFRGESQVGSWLHRVAANYCLMKLRHRRVVDQVEEPLETEDGQFRPDGEWSEPPRGVWGRRADELALDGELRDRIVAAVDTLPDSYRAVFVLRDLEGMSYEEIADALGTTVPAIKSRLHRARLQLRGELETYFNPAED